MHKVAKREGYCPSCQSWYIRRHRDIWCCKTCSKIFDEPMKSLPEKAKTGGSGQIAGRTYRMQIALEQLSQSGKQIKTAGNYYGRKP